MDLTVVTATWRRPQLLAQCLRQFALQSVGHLSCEHIVVSDCVDDRARGVSSRYGANYAELDRVEGRITTASLARDKGIELAKGEYLCFWDDDNIYYPHALVSLYAVVHGVDVGIVQVVDNGSARIPHWNGGPVYCDIDTMCFVVRAELARQVRWSESPEMHHDDYNWIKK